MLSYVCVFYVFHKFASDGCEGDRSFCIFLKLV